MLFIATGSLVGIGALAASWKLIDAMNPAADVRAARVLVDLAKIGEGAERTIAWQGVPIIVSRRTATQQARLRQSLVELRDPESQWSKQPVTTKNWHRSLRADIGVLHADCTRGDCIVHRREGVAAEGEYYQCPCCGAAYDLAGRLFNGPAPQNLPVPPHRFVGANALEIGIG
jgi:ubiquinol-cytochrome c reductase iron-sulfur subunit